MVLGLAVRRPGIFETLLLPLEFGFSFELVAELKSLKDVRDEIFRLAVIMFLLALWRTVDAPI